MTRQNGDNLNIFWREIKLDLSPFWRVAVLDTSNTQRLGEKSSWICHRFGFGAVLIDTRHMSYWFIIVIAPPVPVFMCIHVNTRVLPVVTSCEQV